jgi:hypothetical protein
MLFVCFTLSILNLPCSCRFSTLTVCWLYLILGRNIIYWLVSFLSIYNVGLPLAYYTWERVVATLALGSRRRRGLAKVWAKREA